MRSSITSYRIINFVFAGIIVSIIIYSGIFSPVANNYPVSCVHEQITGMNCPSCGISHSFSYLVRGDLKNAIEWNIYGPRVFLFFVFQLVLRLSNNIHLSRRPESVRKVILLDVLLSAISFILGFSQFVIYTAKLIF